MKNGARLLDDVVVHIIVKVESPSHAFVARRVWTITIAGISSDRCGVRDRGSHVRKMGEMEVKAERKTNR